MPFFTSRTHLLRWSSLLFIAGAYPAQLMAASDDQRVAGAVSPVTVDPIEFGIEPDENPDFSGLATPSLDLEQVPAVLTVNAIGSGSSDLDAWTLADRVEVLPQSEAQDRAQPLFSSDSAPYFAAAQNLTALSQPLWLADSASVADQVELSYLPATHFVNESYADGADDQARVYGPGKDYGSFGKQIGSVTGAIGLVAAYYTVANSEKIFQDPIAPHFKYEGWFGRSTANAGVDKLAHAYSSYVISELFYARLKQNTDDAPGIKYTAAAIGFGMMLYTELWDSVERTGGWSWEDVTMNAVGSGFSILRNSVPGLDRKLDYRIMIKPNSSIYSRQGKDHFAQQRYFLALKFSGFEQFERTPYRFLELHLGYHAKDFNNEVAGVGNIAKRHVFVGIGINLHELLFKKSRTRVGRAVGEALDYFQPPYTALHTDLTR